MNVLSLSEVTYLVLDEAIIMIIMIVIIIVLVIIIIIIIISILTFIINTHIIIILRAARGGRPHAGARLRLADLGDREAIEVSI